MKKFGKIAIARLKKQQSSGGRWITGRANQIRLLRSDKVCVPGSLHKMTDEENANDWNLSVFRSFQENETANYRGISPLNIAYKVL